MGMPRAAAGVVMVAATCAVACYGLAAMDAVDTVIISGGCAMFSALPNAVSDDEALLSAWNRCCRIILPAFIMHLRKDCLH